MNLKFWFPLVIKHALEYLELLVIQEYIIRQ